jgi:hypothetical protein
MNPWLETLAVVLLALSGVIFGHWFSRLPRPYWAIGYLIPLGLVLLFGLAAHKPALSLVPPVSWIMLGRNKFAIMAFIVTLVLTTPCSRLGRRRDRILVVLLQVVIVFQMSVWPVLAPAFNRGYLARLQTRIDGNGICRQSNDYNCGPAAAVTALRRLGFHAGEGEIAILAHTSTAVGTSPDILARELQSHYGKEGLLAEYRVFKDLSELRAAGLTLAVVKYSFLIDHYVTVLEVNDHAVVAGDPLNGLAELSLSDFERNWRFVGVVLKRK